MRTSPAAWRVAAIAHLAPEELSRTIEQDDTAQWVEAAAGCGIAEAQMKLGHMLLTGDGIGTDARAAFACFLCAAESGDAGGHAMLAHCLENGRGTEKNLSAAVSHYRRAAALGHAAAMNFLGCCHQAGIGMTPDRLLARAWYRRSAMGGNFRGAYNYATMIAAEGCIAGALHWFGRALLDAPAPDRNDMVTALLSHENRAVRALVAHAV
ncbi:MAG: tetratricopeptide repeat protein [Rhizomicrobium sp.]